MNLKIDWKSKINGMAPKKQQLLIMLLAGILLVVIALPAKEKGKGGDEVSVSGTDESAGTAGYEEAMERKLSRMLENVSGVGKNEVMITLKSTSEKIIEKDKENTSQSVDEADSAGGTRTTADNSSAETTIYKGTNENQTPYVKKEMTPEIEGVIVIAEGGGDPTTIKNITEAVQALFNVDTHKIKIMKMKQKK